MNLQVINTILVGATIKRIQIISPIISLLSMSFKTYGYHHIRYERRGLARCFILTQGISTLPILWIIYEWSNFDNVLPKNAPTDLVPRNQFSLIDGQTVNYEDVFGKAHFICYDN